MEEYNEQEIRDAAWMYLRSNTTASLRFGEHFQDISFVIGHQGEIVISAMYAMLQPCDTILYVPDYSDDCMEMHVSLRQFSEHGEEGRLADRWQVYHGTPPDVQWAILEIDAARFHEMFVDGEGLQRENPFAEDEPSLCKQMNTTHQEQVSNACVANTHIEVNNPLVVGVDPLGIDVRASHGIIRIQFESEMQNTAVVLEFISSF